jgi:hypothetical protein
MPNARPTNIYIVEYRGILFETLQDIDAKSSGVDLSREDNQQWQGKMSDSFLIKYSDGTEGIGHQSEEGISFTCGCGCTIEARHGCPGEDEGQGEIIAFAVTAGARITCPLCGSLYFFEFYETLLQCDQA